MGGQDKGLIELNGTPLIELLIAQLEKQFVEILINANRNQDRYQHYQYSVVGDQLDNFQGPLAGFAAAMTAVKTKYILTLPCDGPLLANDYVSRYVDTHNQTGASICVAHDGERLQPVHALMAVDLLVSLNDFLESGDRKIDRWYAQHEFKRVDFSDCSEMFRNINTPSDHQALACTLHEGDASNGTKQ